MNTVLLLFSVGVFVCNAIAASENKQVNQVENTPREKPPKLLWDPDKRMWVESDDEDFYGKDYSGDNENNNDFSFLDTANNQTDLFEEEPIDQNGDNLTETVDEEGIDEQISSQNKGNCNNCNTVTLPTTSSSPVGVISTSKAVDDLVKYEEKITTNIDNPLNQALDLSTVKGNREKVDESRANIEVEVNPATEYPLWALEFESKRTRPLQEPNVTELHAYPVKGTKSRDKNVANDSTIFNIKPVPTDLPIGTKPKNPSYNIGVDIPDYQNPATDTKLSNSVKPNIPIHDTNYNSPVITDVKQGQSTITVEPRTEPSPEVVLPENPLVDNDTNIDKKDEKITTNRPINVGGQNGNTSITPGSKNPTATPSAIPQPTPIPSSGTSTSSGRPAPCLPTITTSDETTLHWPETPSNVTTIPQELCIKEDNTPVTRTCLNSVWSVVNGTCSNLDVPSRTLLLTELLHSKPTDPTRMFMNLTQLTSDSINVTSYQIHIMAKLLERVASSSSSTDGFVETVNNIMHYNPAELKLAQSTLNSTDKILYSLDNSLLKANVPENGYRSIVTDKLLVQKADFQKIDFSGFKLSSSNNVKGFHADDVSALDHDMIDRHSTNLELALLISEELRKTIKQCSGSRANPNVISTVFYDDALFNSNRTLSQNEGKIISVLFPGFNCSFNVPLQIIFKPRNNSTEQKCGYWRYGATDQSENIKGEWAVEGDPKPFLNTSYHLCEFSHVTHFSLLVLGDLAVELSEADRKALDVITAIGSGLSLLGLLAVFLTAIVFKSYRSANAVVIHFSVAMAAQIVILFLADHAGQNMLMCTILGAALHYVVISQFCWMLTIALLQYKRYVLVFSNPTKYFMTKACAFAWGAPIIPIIAILIISTENYGRNSYGLCYAVGNYFIFGILIPVALIVFINLLVFLRIMIYIASRKIKAHRKMDNASLLQLRLAIMLYFLLGLTWGFGLIAAIGGGVVYSYLFCITATLQGFVLFLFFIALSEKTRSLWGTTKWCPCFDKKKKYDVNTDSSSHPMVRRPTSTNTSDTYTEGTGNDVFQKYKNRSSMDF